MRFCSYKHKLYISVLRLNSTHNVRKYYILMRIGTLKQKKKKKSYTVA